MTPPRVNFSARHTHAPLTLLTGMKRHGNRILLVAIVGSLVAHLLFAFFVRNVRPVEAKAEQPPREVRIIVIHTPAPTPTPKPPPPTKAVPQRVARALHPRLVHTHTRPVTGDQPPEAAPSAGPPGGDAPPAAGTPGPVAPTVAPQATPTKAACAVPSAPAVATNVVQAQMPDAAAGMTATAKVQVTLGASGAVEDAKIYASAGNMLLDRAAIRAARQSTYRAAIVDCVPTGGTYLFTVDFQS